MNRARVKLLVSVLAILAAAAAVWRSLHDAPPSFSASVPSEIGRVLALEAGKLLKPGGKVIVIARDTEAFTQPAFDAVLRSLNQTLREAGTPPVAVRSIQLDPQRPLQVPPGDFVELLRKAGTSDVIVSLLGPPFLSEEQRASVGVVKPRVVAFWPGTLAEYANLRPLFEQRLLSSAVIHRPEGLGLGGKTPTPPAEKFEALYQIVNGNGIPPTPLPGLP